MSVVRPFRFGMQAERILDARAWVALAQRAEAGGYSSFQIPDHLGRLSTFPALMAAAAATRHITLSTYVLNQDFRAPGLLAHEAASVQLLTDGRLELGVGAGWARHEYMQAGLQFDSAGMRVARFEEYLLVVKGLLAATEPFSFAGRFFELHDYAPLPKHSKPVPILAAGGSPRILAISGRLADIISVSTPATANGRVDMPKLSLEAVENKVGYIRAAAGARFDQIEMNMTVRDLRLTDDRPATARQLLAEGASVPDRLANVDQITEDDVLNSPHVAIGSVQQIVEQFEAARERWGFTYLEVNSTDSEAVAPILARLSGK
jgi:probable F420-dependent oxidoreductase